MHLPLDPKKPWEDKPSPTSPAESMDSNPTRHSTKKRNPPTLISGATSESGLDSSTDGDDVFATPTPLPSIHTPRVRSLAIRRRISNPPDPIETSTDASTTTDDDAVQDLYSNFSPGYPRSKTPTPTEEDFREMLTTYKELHSEEAERLAQMAERITKSRVDAARAEERERTFVYTPGPEMSAGPASGNMLASALLSAPAPRSATGGPLPPSATSMGMSPLPSEMANTPSRVRAQGKPSRSLQEIRKVGLKIKIYMRLAKVKDLLSSEEDEMPSYEDTREAASLAYEALTFAQSEDMTAESASDSFGSPANETAAALQGRCAYYVGIAEYVLAQKRDEGETEGIFLSESNRARLLEYFELALLAKEGGFEEGTLADTWVEHLQEEQEEVERQREKGPQRTSWIGWLSQKLNPFQKATPGVENEAASSSPTTTRAQTQVAKDTEDDEDSLRPRRKKARRTSLSSGGSSPPV
jgi:hypothetical protein